ncbi:hypothetical protein BHM03_00000814 [Ensete ventricosum]|nr:hypothetical protein BHM03_00000814 [Ensete ventricosum]
MVADGVAVKVLVSTSKGRQQRLTRADGEAEEAVTPACAATNDSYSCCDPWEVITELGRQRLVLLWSRAGDAAGQQEAMVMLLWAGGEEGSSSSDRRRR